MLMVISLALLQGIASEESWQRYTPDDSAFTVTLPGMPRTSVSYTETRFGVLPTRSVTAYLSDNTSFSVSWTVYRNSAGLPSPSDSLVTKMVRALATSKDAELLDAGEAGSKGASGRPAAMRSPDGRTVRVRFFFAGNRVYQLTTETSPDSGSTERTRRFLESFAFPK